MNSVFPKKTIRNMLHAMGISHTSSNDYMQPNKRYSPYPTSYRNYYQVESCEDWEVLVETGFAVKGKSIGMNYYSVTKEGKEYLQSLGYKWHEQKKRSGK